MLHGVYKKATTCAHSTRSTHFTPRVLHFSAVYYFSDESSSSTASGNAGGGESDSDSSYCPTSDSCESETVVKKGPVLGSIVVHPLVLQFIEPLTGTEGPSCNLRVWGQFALQCGVTLLLFPIRLAL